MGEVFQEDQIDTIIDYWATQRDTLGFKTVWSIWECPDIDFEIFTDKPRTVVYDLFDTPITAVAKTGSVRELWRAADEIYRKAEQQFGDWHYFIENFEAQADGTLLMTTGS